MSTLVNYNFLSSWSTSFYKLLLSAKATNTYVYTYRPGGPLGKRVSANIYQQNLKKQQEYFNQIYSARVELVNLFQQNKVDPGIYTPIVGALDNLLSVDITNLQIDKIISWYNANILFLIQAKKPASPYDRIKGGREDPRDRRK
jgi:hypothetical protein